jgi:4-hydroxy-tetrahydrodipicolinate reductase
MRRVAVWGTGDVGHYALRGVITHPDLELVGLRVWNEAKVGRDAGELIGWEPVGVRATTSTEEVLAAEPDCFVHVGPSRNLDPVPGLLRAGVNVVTLGSAGLVHPRSWQHPRKAEIEQACVDGGSSLFYGGIDAGFASHTLPIVLTAICESIELLTIYEVRDYDPLPLHQLDYFNFGKASGEGARFATPGGISGTWAPSLRLVADALGVQLERIDEFFETALSPETFAVPAMVVREGTIGAARFGLSGIVDGVERLRIEHVNRLRRDLVPEWRSRQGYGVDVTGTPCYALHLDLWDPAGRQQRPALFGTGMYLVNAVPAVCDAAPGIRTVLDLPYVTGRRVSGERREDTWTLSQRILSGEKRG